MRWWPPLLAVLLLGGCSTKLTRDGHTETTVDVKYLAKTEVDRIADTDRSDVIDSLLLIADKLYKRNPREWRQSGLASREAAVDRLRRRVRRDWPEFRGMKEGQVASLGFTAAYSGDRVAALIYGLLDMVDAAFGYKEEFYILDGLDEKKLYNAARNMEIAIWKLEHERRPDGSLYLISNELDPAHANLSFEREFGRIIGLLDLMAEVVADRNGRNLSRLTQTVVGTIFLPVGF